jgi:hypothetical protein
LRNGLADAATPHTEPASREAGRRDDGRLFLVAKDSVGAGGLHFFVRSTSGSWSQRIRVDSGSAAQPTRPTLALNVQNSDAYVLYHNSTDKRMYSARAPMDSPGFVRCALLMSGNNATSTKQNVNTSTRLVAAASVGGQILPGLLTLGRSRGGIRTGDGGIRSGERDLPT